MTRVLSRLASVVVGLVITLGALQAAETQTALQHSAAAAPAATESGAAGAHAEHHGITSAPVPLFQLGWFRVTNSMVAVWIVVLLIVLFVKAATRQMTLVPSGLQNFCEWLVESLYDFLEGILGKHLVKRTFWFFATIFLVILCTNWMGLIPGVGTIGRGTADPSSPFPLALSRVSEPILRGGNADLNMTLAMALLSSVLWLVWALQANGVVGTLKHLFAPGSDATGFMKWFMVVVFLVVGVLEVLSISFRPVSLSLRLYGNIFAGENILESMTTLVPWLGWALPIPFYFLELLVGLVQALVFCLLTAVFTLLICEHAEENGHAGGDKHEAGGAPGAAAGSAAAP